MDDFCLYFIFIFMKEDKLKCVERNPYIQPKGLNNKKCKNLTGHRFSNLVAIEIDPQKTSRIHWKCLCDCGNYKSVATKHLTGNVIKSCGCRHFLKGKESNSWKGHEEISGKYWSNIINGAKSRNFDFSITIEDAWKRLLEQNRKCALSGVELKFNSFVNKCKDGNASLDRIDNTKGYALDNIQWVDKNINRIKMDMSEDEFVKWCKLVASYRA